MAGCTRESPRSALRTRRCHAPGPEIALTGLGWGLAQVFLNYRDLQGRASAGQLGARGGRARREPSGQVGDGHRAGSSLLIKEAWGSAGGRPRTPSVPSSGHGRVCPVSHAPTPSSQTPSRASPTRVCIAPLSAAGPQILVLRRTPPPRWPWSGLTARLLAAALQVSPRGAASLRRRAPRAWSGSAGRPGFCPRGRRLPRHRLLAREPGAPGTWSRCRRPGPPGTALNIRSSVFLLQPPPRWGEECYISGPFLIWLSKNIHWTTNGILFSEGCSDLGPTFVPGKKFMMSQFLQWRGSSLVNDAFVVSKNQKAWSFWCLQFATH